MLSERAIIHSAARLIDGANPSIAGYTHSKLFQQAALKITAFRLEKNFDLIPFDKNK